MLTITVDRAFKRNAVDGEMARGIAATQDRLNADPGLRAGMLISAGGFLSADADLGVISGRESDAGLGRKLAGIAERRPAPPRVAANETSPFAGRFDIPLAGESSRFGPPKARDDAAFHLFTRFPWAVPPEILVNGNPVSGIRAPVFWDGQVFASSGRREVATAFLERCPPERTGS